MAWGKRFVMMAKYEAEIQHLVDAREMKIALYLHWAKKIASGKDIALVRDGRVVDELLIEMMGANDVLV